MTYLTDTADSSQPSSGLDLAALDKIDRILLGCCAAVWLAALGAGVAATVALVDLAEGHTASRSESGTPWILYTVIAVSALVILAAVPLLLRARRAALEEPAPESRPQAPTPQPQGPVSGAEAPTEKLRAASPVAAPETSDSPPPSELEQSAAAPDVSAIAQLWLRCSAGIACATGVATLLTAVSTYLMAVDSDTVAWVLYGVAGAVTLGMAAIPWYILRELRTLIEEH